MFSRVRVDGALDKFALDPARVPQFVSEYAFDAPKIANAPKITDNCFFIYNSPFWMKLYHKKGL